ncbi:MAG: filamentous hemagglutinin N-terminal domain-containing protein [Limisphaerales bacterium]
MIRTFNVRRNAVLRCIVTGFMLFGVVVNSIANPTGLTIGSGTATISQNGSQMTITASHNAFLNWQRFNIAAGETTIFNQPSASSIVWNRVNDPNPSQIFGNLQANGLVVLLNSSGFYFGPNSFVSAAGLVVSTANCVPPENNGGTWEFNGPPPLASIINYGHIQIGNGGQAFLIADHIENHGTIEAPGGTIGLAAGQTVLLSERPDGRGMSMQVQLPQGSVDNYGNLIADAGTISLNARVVNQDGLLQANSVHNQNGIIELVASDSLNLGAESQILSRGDDSIPGSSGGTVTLKSGNNFSDSIGGEIIVTGGAQGGDGGSIEISAPNVLSLDSHMDATAQSGWNGGTFFLDPVNIILGTSTAGGAINVNTAFAGFSEIILQATANITLNTGTILELELQHGHQCRTAHVAGRGQHHFQQQFLASFRHHRSQQLVGDARRRL